MRIREVITYEDGKALAEIALASTETKPTDGLATGSTITEADTGKTFVLDEDSATWTEYTSGGGGGGGSDAVLASYMDGSITELVVPSTANGLAQYSVYRRPNLVRLVINASGTIGKSGVLNNSALKHIVVGDGITEINENAFASNAELETIEIGSGIASIDRYLWSSTIPTNMQSVTIRATTPPTINGQTFYGVGPNHPVAFYVPAESVDAYKAASYWSNYASYIQAIPE